MKIGLDIGSTTLKCVVLDENDKIIYHSYERHFSQITQKTADLLKTIKSNFSYNGLCEICISGSAGMGLAQNCNIDFVQEVFATRIAVRRLIPNADVVIELGGEDAKILFLTNGMEVRMNGSCAGGTGAFIDQMAALLNISLDDLNLFAQSYDKLYTIASRCGVFAKSDIQPLLNQGAQKNDISASILYAVVNQTIAGLAQGRDITGNIVYLGGPLTFLSELRKSFDNSLNTKGICPENSLFYVALGAAYSNSTNTKKLDDVIELIDQYQADDGYASSAPLFNNQDEYDAFITRHHQTDVTADDLDEYIGNAYLGIDAGSTTVKAVLIDEQDNIIYSQYRQSSGNPIEFIKDFLNTVYTRYPQIKIISSAVTGYGEDMVKNAFNMDFGIVETIAHFTAAKKFRPNVDFIIDIGGQDIKCFKIKNGIIDNIFLNEACSSGCGSFLQTFAGALGYSIDKFAKLGLLADRPVDLGSRCTVFMNSSVKQAQKDGASIENISAGLSISVVKNALYKVIRTSASQGLGENIVVQGGTFLNDAVLRAFEQETQRQVIRPNISGLMGAYGTALYAKSKGKSTSTILTYEQLKSFTHDVQVVSCGICSNKCRLTVNTFDGGRKFIGGNRCERPVTKRDITEDLNIYAYKLSLLKKYMQKTHGNTRGKIGLPMGLNMYEMLPFWHRFFTTLGFDVVVSPQSNRKLYLNGQHTIPSDTICFPAKLIHGHIQALIDDGIKHIFYPCMTYNFDEGLGDNHFNCPVVAYYPEVIKANVPSIESGNVDFIYNYIGVHKPKTFTVKMHEILNGHFASANISLKEVKVATKLAFKEYDSYLEQIRNKADKIILEAQRNNQPIIVLAGRPYHLDPEINHGIDGLINSCGAAVISEESISALVPKVTTTVLNQWTYHARLYAAAEYIKDKSDINLVQLVSFGCGVDAITSDEIRDMLEHSGKIYTQIKIDEITNPGAVKIRLRSLFAALEQGKEGHPNGNTTSKR